MTNEELAEKYPVLYHMAEGGSWPSIQKHGLLSTEALLKLFEIAEDRQEKILSRWRSGPEVISHPLHGTAVLRDQSPMPEAELQNCLNAMTSRQWYQLVNGKVFFWAREWHLRSFLRAYRGRSHLVISIDAALLLKLHGERVRLCHINSGSVRGRKMRGTDTFKTVADYSGSPSSVREVTVEFKLSGIQTLAVSVKET